MKLLLLSVLFVMFTSGAIIAQSATSKGSITIDGSLTISSQSYEDASDALTIFSLNPQAGYFFADNASFGLSLSYNHISLGGTSNTLIGIGPSFRYYFDEGKFKPFLSVGYLYTRTSNSSNDDKTEGTQYTFATGIDYFIIPSVALESTLNYRINREKLPDRYKPYYKTLIQKSTILELGVGINIFLF